MSQSRRNGQGNDAVYWILALGLLFTGFLAPIGVLMMVLKVLGGSRQRGRHPYYEQQEGLPPVGARTTTRPPAAESKAGKGWQDRTAQLDRKGKKLTIWGVGLMALFLCVAFSALGDAAYWLFQGDLAFFVEELFDAMPIFCLAGGGLGCLWAGLRKRKQARRWRRYLAMAGEQPSVSIAALSSAAGLPPHKVREDLADMLDHGLFPEGYLDYGGDRLVLRGGGVAEAPVVLVKETAPAPQSQDQENAILAEIREVNNAIANEKLSAQIDRVGVITAKILDYQKSHPEKAPQLHSFLSYYLPTTLKVLRAYGQLEDQEVSGENITAAMQRIEGMMDKVVEGFEKQLDLLFQGDAMDITTDVEVLERMLAKDGLSDQGGLTLGV
ncbi:MAG: hypothetical protein HFF50_04940 [Lawsonibacter sp.]|nr:hypothetical protein [Lawsonibacter sp.]